MSQPTRLINSYDKWVLDEHGYAIGILLDNTGTVSFFDKPQTIDNLNVLGFNLTAGATADEGEFTWNAVEQTLDLGLSEGVTLQLGQETHYHVENNTASDILEGVLVRYAGTAGNSGKLRVAPWTGVEQGLTLMGLATSTITSGGGTGYVTCFGKVRGIQTDGANYGETWVSGDILYAGPTGGLTKTEPAAPHVKASIAVVISAHHSNGTLFVRPQLGSNLGDDELVQLGTLANRDGLQYNSTSGRFENGPLIVTAPASVTPTANRDIAFELTNNTTLTVKVKGADGTVRSATLTLS